MTANKTFYCDFNKSEEENLEAARAYEAKAKELYDNLLIATVDALSFFKLNNTSRNRAKLLDELNIRGGAVAHVKANFEWKRKQAAEKEEKERKEKQTAERAAHVKELQALAIIYLLDHGKKISVDFTLDNAIQTANDIAYGIEVKNRTSSNSLYDFDGSDTCEDCTGWDGISHRCNCGNRRVYWESDGDFTNMTLHAQAY